MKRGLLALAILFLLLVPFVSAAANVTDDISSSLSVSEAASAGADVVRDKTSKVDDFLDKERPIPEKLQKIVKVIFRFEGSVTLSDLIIAAMLLIFITLFFIDVIKIFGFFTEETSTYVGLILGLIGSMTGAIRSLTSLFVNIGSVFGYLESWSAGALFVSAIVLVALIILFKKLGKMIARSRGFEEAYQKGAKAGADMAYVRAQREVSEVGDKI